MAVSSVGVTGTQGQQDPTGHNKFNDVDMDDFLKLMITELQNQDPMNPMSNQEMLQQINSIREIESNTRLTESLEAVQLGQSMATASGLIGKFIKGLADDQTMISGWVQQVSVTDGTPKLHIDDKTISLDNVSDILAAQVADQEEATQ
jgi:flagellar basal-body rod modification protein FlgD